MDILEKWPRPVLYPLPDAVNGIAQPRVTLSGIWKECDDPEGNYTAADYDDSLWRDMQVPSDLQLADDRFHKNRHETVSVYRRFIDIPRETDGMCRRLRFDGANCLARVYVNGTFAGEHYGGFTAWDCDITRLTRPGERACLTVETVDKSRELSGYNKGGLIRDVTLYFVPEACLERLQAETTFDEKYADAVLKLEIRAARECELAFTLTAPGGEEAASLTGYYLPGKDDVTLIPVSAPLKWTAETPYLYRLTCRVTKDGIETETVTKYVGFRVIERRGKNVYVNGMPVKLHGSCRHDIHPVTGYSLTHEDVVRDVQLFKEANCNFIRTSHYPPRPDFLDECDRMGIYVECETSVAFQGQGGRYSMNDPAYTASYMGQWADMIERDRSHPCVIMWSLANESYWGSNFAEERDYAKAADPSRLTIFSYPITMPEDEEGIDIWSLHYANWDQDPSVPGDNWEWGYGFKKDVPVLHDEYIHVPCYNIPDQKRDQGVRDWYGDSVRAFWDGIYRTEGALGGAIWAGIDHNTVKSGCRRPIEWGLIDGWRRKKPEHFLVRKAYSPIRIEAQELPVGPDGTMRVPVENRHNHLDLSELTIEWSGGGKTGTVCAQLTPPRGSTVLEIPCGAREGDSVRLSFTDPFGYCEDTFEIRAGLSKPREMPRLTAGWVGVDTSNGVVITGRDFVIRFSKETGLIERCERNGRTVLTGGPYINLTGITLKKWELASIAAGNDEEGRAVVTIKGGYGKVKVTFTLTVDVNCLIRTGYVFDDMPYPSPNKMRLYYGWDFGGYEEIGVRYILPEEADGLTWDKKALWTDYPEDHIGRPQGRAARCRDGGKAPEERYWSRPGWAWKDDMRNFPLFGQYDTGRRGTKDFTSGKYHIYSASVLSGDDALVTALSDGRDSVRAEAILPEEWIVQDRDAGVRYTGNWVQIKDEHGSMNGTETICADKGAMCEVPFTGTNVAWVGSRDTIGGKARVYLDGEEKAVIDMSVNENTAGIARGHEKEHGITLWSAQDLEYGRHVLTIECLGECEPFCDGAYVYIDHFVVYGDDRQGEVALVINNAFNFPELSWGNRHDEPLTVETGYHNAVYLAAGGYRQER